jgi:hypothetical protein
VGRVHLFVWPSGTLINRWTAVRIFLKSYIGTLIKRRGGLTLIHISRRQACFLWWRAPQQMLRTHSSLEAYCATLWWRLGFPCNRTSVEWNWQGKTEVLGEKPVPLPLCPPQIPHGLTRDRTRSSAVRGRRLTAWAMARPDNKVSLGEDTNWFFKVYNKSFHISFFF